MMSAVSELLKARVRSQRPRITQRTSSRTRHSLWIKRRPMPPRHVDTRSRCKDPWSPMWEHLVWQLKGHPPLSRGERGDAALDEQNILYRGQSKAAGFSNEAAFDRVEANTVTQPGYCNAASSLLTGAGHSGWYGY